MSAKYYNYKEIDYLMDDYFVQSMLQPTSESDHFWKELIDEEEIDVNEFISAYMILKHLHENKPEVPSERIDVIWNRLNNTLKKKESTTRNILLSRYIAVACSIIGIIILSGVFLLKNQSGKDKQLMSDLACLNIINTKQSVNQIQLVLGEDSLKLDGTKVDVECDKNGQLKINQQSVAINHRKKKTKDTPQYSQLRVPYGKRAFLKLSDGTSLWVNSGSTVIFPTVFDKAKREIRVEGEIFADVTHNIKWPFIVSTKKIDIQVLGTTFNVSAYANDKETNVVLIRGSVSAKPKKGQVTLIKPNQLFSHTDEACILKEVDVEEYTSWHNGKYIFHNEPIENILLRLARYYNVTMILPSSASGITCSGKLELKEELNHLLNGLSEITSMSYANKDNEYRIMFNESLNQK